MTLPSTFTNLQQLRFLEIIGSINKSNVNERIKEPLNLNFYDAKIQIQAGVTILEALCYMYSFLGQTSGNNEQRTTRLKLIENCIESAYKKIISWEETIWDEKDKANNTTAEWLAWGGSSKSLKDLLDKYPKLIKIEQEAPRNAFDVTMEVAHLSLEQKKELGLVLITKGITGNNLQTYANILQNEQLFENFKDSIAKAATHSTNEEFFSFAYNIIYKLCILISLAFKKNIEPSIIQNLKFSACELTIEIIKQNKGELKELLEYQCNYENYKGSLLHWILEFGNDNLKNIIKNYDEGREINFYTKDYNQNTEGKTILEWIANFRYDILKELGQLGYLNANKKEENLKILLNLVENGSGRNNNVKIASFFESLLTHQPPLFHSKLDSVKQAIFQKGLKISLISSQLPTEKYKGILEDHNDCLMAIHNYELEQTKIIGQIDIYQ